MAIGNDLTSSEGAWIDFCERHAIIAAQDFSRSCMQYINLNIPQNARSLVNHKDLLKKYIDKFTEEFERDFTRRQLGGNTVTNGTAAGTHEDSVEIEEGSPKMPHKPFFRR